VWGWLPGMCHFISLVMPPALSGDVATLSWAVTAWSLDSASF
jgi:hypothetical protein